MQTRSVLLAELDALLVERAMVHPRSAGAGGARQAEQPAVGEDRYVAKAVGRIVASSRPRRRPAARAGSRDVLPAGGRRGSFGR